MLTAFEALFHCQKTLLYDFKQKFCHNLPRQDLKSRILSRMKTFLSLSVFLWGPTLPLKEGRPEFEVKPSPQAQRGTARRGLLSSKV